MMSILVALTLGLVAAALGGEFFVRGSAALALRMHIPASVVGATVAAFATSSPEASVAVNAALGGLPNIALGDALGSNIVNVGLILGLALAIKPLQTDTGHSHPNFLFAALAPILTLLFCLDQKLSFWDGALMILTFAIWISLTIRSALRDRHLRSSEGPPKISSGKRILGELSTGILLLVLAGRLIVFSAKGITDAFGLDPFVVGATLVAIGTSVPELATVLVSRLKGYDEIGLGAVLGSNIFNNLFIVSIAALIHPISIIVSNVALGATFGSILVLLTLPNRKRVIPSSRGFILIVVYGAFVGSFLI